MRKGWGRIPEPRYPDRQPTDLLGSVVKNTESAFIVYICGGGVLQLCAVKNGIFDTKQAINYHMQNYPQINTLSQHKMLPNIA